MPARSVPRRGRTTMARHDDMPRHDDPTNHEPRPRTPPLTRTGSTMPQLKMDIDSGATGDKLAVLDVGMVPLGTDGGGRRAAHAGTGPCGAAGRAHGGTSSGRPRQASGCRKGAGDPHPGGGRARARGGTYRLNALGIGSPARQACVPAASPSAREVPSSRGRLSASAVLARVRNGGSGATTLRG